jgi:hypothetical protein
MEFWQFFLNSKKQPQIALTLPTASGAMIQKAIAAAV